MRENHSRVFFLHNLCSFHVVAHSCASGKDTQDDAEAKSKLVAGQNHLLLLQC